MKKYFIVIFSLLSIAFTIVTAQTTSTTAAQTKMQWWKDAKFGMFIHWGVYSVPAGTYEGKQVKGIGEWIMNTAKIPVATYRQYSRQFNPVKYNAEAWVKMAKAAGMKYIVITAKHHDGFALFDSKVTNWNVVDATPYGKDLLKPLVVACRKEGIRIGLYYSQAQDWNHAGGAASGGHWDKAQNGNFDTYLDSIAVPQLKEILSNFGEIDILWWDTPQDMTKERANKFMPLLKEHPNLIMNNRLGGGYKGDIETPEQFVPATGFPGRNWETCQTMNDTWGYKSYDENWKSAKVLIRGLTDAVSKGGNFLLNVGPTSLGEIPAPSRERLSQMGKWLDVNKESIYGTTASPFAYLSWGRATQKEKKLYLHVFDYPVNGLLHVPMKNNITKAYLLSDKKRKPLIVKKEAERSIINLPKINPDSINTVIVVEYAGQLQPDNFTMSGKIITSSSQKNEDKSVKNLLDGDRLTVWEAAAGEGKATLEIDLLKPTTIATLIADEPWHPWENKSQHIILQYKDGANWKIITELNTSGSGITKNFTPVTARYFRMFIENKNQEPTLCEWQMYEPE